MEPMKDLVAKAVGEIAAGIEDKTEKYNCHRCGKSFSRPATPVGQYIKICPDCLDRSIREREDWEERNRQRANQQAWRKLCPPAYRAIDRSRLPNIEAHDKVMAWEFGPQGLVLFGETGKGKTRSAWALLGKLIIQGRRVSALDSMAGIQYAAEYNRGASDVEEWIEDLISAEVLLLDDVLKVKLTDSFESAVFTMIDQRIAHERPTILTSNDTGATLAARVSQDRANPLLRRLREHCQQICF